MLQISYLCTDSKIVGTNIPPQMYYLFSYPFIRECHDKELKYLG